MTNIQEILVVLLLCAVSLIEANHRVKRIVGGRPAAVPPEDDPVVFVYFNDHDAKVYGTRDQPDGYYNFRGIRYAEPPVGRFRFQRARKLRLTGDVNATKPGPPCCQPDPENKEKVIGSEDCLFLNVFTPALPDGSEGFPVLMWIHGGGYRRGSASQYGVRHLINQKLVVVTIQYRLGSLGFLSAGVKELPGNAGMFDMSLALEWIKDYIGFFGGNPNKITVFGQGTGASSAILLSLSQLTQGFLGGVLAMSGTALSSFAIDHNPLATGRELAKQNGCPNEPVLEMVKCLQEVSVSKLIEADNGFQELRLAAQGVLAGITGLLGAAPCIEGGNDGRFLPNFIPESPLDGLRSGIFPKIPLLTGVTRDETASALLGKYRNEILENMKKSPNFLNQLLSGIVSTSDLIGQIFNRTDELIQNIASKYFQFPQANPAVLSKVVEATGDALFNLPAFQMAKMWSKNVGKTFFYRFDQISKKFKHGGGKFLHGLPLVEDSTKINIGDDNGIGHGDDLPFIFDPEPMYGDLSSNSFGLIDPDDQKVQNITTHLIAEFARTGEPMLPGEGEKWPAFSEEKNDYVTISSDPRPHSNFRFCQMALWGGIFPRLQSATCETLWGITKFSEDALHVVDHALNQGVGQGAIINTVINNTVAGNVGGGAIINSVLNKTLPPSHNIQVGNGALVNTILDKTIHGQPGIQTTNTATGGSAPAIGGGALLNSFLNAAGPQKTPEEIISGTPVPLISTHETEVLISEPDKLVAVPEKTSTPNEQENYVNPVTESTSTTPSRVHVAPAFPLLVNRPTLFPRFPRPTLFPRPIFQFG